VKTKKAALKRQKILAAAAKKGAISRCSAFD
jgi:hypothetical protein